MLFLCYSKFSLFSQQINQSAHIAQREFREFFCRLTKRLLCRLLFDSWWFHVVSQPANSAATNQRISKTSHCTHNNNRIHVHWFDTSASGVLFSLSSVVPAYKRFTRNSTQIDRHEHVVVVVLYWEKPVGEQKNYEEISYFSQPETATYFLTWFRLPHNSIFHSIALCVKDITAVEKREQIGKNGIYGGTNANRGERVKKSNWIGASSSVVSCRSSVIYWIISPPNLSIEHFRVSSPSPLPPCAMQETSIGIRIKTNKNPKTERCCVSCRNTRRCQNMSKLFGRLLLYASKNGSMTSKKKNLLCHSSVFR